MFGEDEVDEIVVGLANGLYEYDVSCECDVNMFGLVRGSCENDVLAGLRVFSILCIRTRWYDVGRIYFPFVGEFLHMIFDVEYL